MQMVRGMHYHNKSNMGMSMSFSLSLGVSSTMQIHQHHHRRPSDLILSILSACFGLNSDCVMAGQYFLIAFCVEFIEIKADIQSSILADEFYISLTVLSERWQNGSRAVMLLI